MCGISGFFCSNNSPITQLQEIITKMTLQLTHRGPDDSGSWIDENRGIALGHRRLSIIDLSPAGHQPMLSFCGRYVCVYNGEIYNFIELKKELEKTGVPIWRGHSDTEVMLAGFSVWGIEATIPRLNGMFACAVFDKEKDCLFLFRDRMGKKPLYYGYQGTSLLFGSELKALTAFPSFIKSINRNALSLYLRHNYVPAPFSIYENIFKLPQSSLITISRKDLQSLNLPRPHQYWSHTNSIINGLEAPRDLSEPEILDKLDSLLRDAVKRRMISDVPLGVFLSGGIDSTLVTALMQVQSATPVKTFSIGFHENNFNEAEYAKLIASYLKTEHMEYYVTPADTLSVIPDLPHIFDEPFSDASQIPAYLVAKLARRHVTVALTGDGGDELFGGYTRYIETNNLYQSLKRIPRGLRTLLSHAMRKIPISFWNMVLPSRYASRQSSPGDRILKFSESFGFRTDINLYKNAFLSHWKNPSTVVLDSEEPEILFIEKQLICLGINFIEKMMYLDAVNYLPDDILVKVDRTSMAVSLETRAPLLDFRVFEFAWKLPFKFKVQNSEGKYILKKILSRYVPSVFFERPKQGFSVPIASWLRNELRDWAEDLLDQSRLRREGYLNVAKVKQVWQAHLSGNRNFSYYLWDILMFQAWLSSIQNN